MQRLASAAMAMDAMMLLVLALLACAPQPSVGLQWDRPLSLPPTIAWHSAVAMDIGAVQIRSNRDNRIRPQAWANFTLQGHLIVVYGGLRSRGDVNDDVWVLAYPLHLNAGGAQQWVRPPSTNAKPQSRSAHTALSLDGHLDAHMAVFGGLSGAGDVRLNSMWVYRLAQNDWVPLGPACPPSFDCDEHDHCNNRAYSIDSCAMPDPDAQQDWRGCSWPAPRSSHTWTRIGNTIYTFAGLRVLSGSLTAVGELWALPIDVEDWNILVNMQQYSSSSTYLYPEDTWTFDAPDCAIKWKLMTRPDASASLLSQPAGAPFPSARHQHAATAFDGKLMIMGGSSSAMNRGGSQLEDLWSYDPVADSWTEMLVTPSFLWRDFASPFMRCTPMVLSGPMADANGSAIYIYGGTSLDGDWNNLMWRAVPASSLNDTADPTEWVWEMQQFKSGFYLASQVGGAAISLGSELLFHGGGSGSQASLSGSDRLQSFDVRTGEMQQFEVHATLPVTTSTVSPTQRFGQLQALIGERMWIYGGESSSAPGTVTDLTYYNVHSYKWSRSGANNPGAPPFYPGGCMVALGEILLVWGGRVPATDGGGGGGGSGSASGGGGGQNRIFSSRMFTINTTTLPVVYRDITSLQRSNTPWNGSNTYTPESVGAVLRDGFLFPLPRVYPGARAVQGKMLLFGGTISNRSETHSNDLWSFDLAEMVWTLLSPADLAVPSSVFVDRRSTPPPGVNLPAGRVHCVVEDNDFDDSELIVGFGMDSAGVLYNDLWSWSMTTRRWTFLTPSADSNIPTARYAAVSGLLEGRLLVSLGATASGQPIDLHEFHISKRRWVRLDDPEDNKVTGAAPGARTFAVGTMFRSLGVWFIWGGVGVRLALYDPHTLHVDLVAISGDPADQGNGRIAYTFSSDLFTLFKFSNTAALPGQRVPTFSWQTLGAAVTFHQWQNPENPAFVMSGFVRYSLQSLYAIDTGLIQGLRLTQPLQISNPSGDSSRIMVIICMTTCFIIESNSRQSIVLIGLQMENGGANAVFQPWLPDFISGAAAKISGGNTRVIFQDCIFRQNQAIGTNAYGGALAIERATVTLERCTFYNNKAPALGGAIHALASRLTINNCVFEKNYVKDDTVSPGSLDQLVGGTGQGGALALIVSLTSIVNTTFASNSAALGGAISALNLINQATSLTELTTLAVVAVRISHSTFQRNKAVFRGGAVHLSEMAATAPEECSYANDTKFLHNEALNSHGGAIYLENSFMRTVNANFTGNTAGLATQHQSAGGGGGGGALFWRPTSLSDPTVRQRVPVAVNTVSADNSAKFGSHHASVPFTLRMVNSDATLRPQKSGQLLNPPLAVELVDVYGQRVNTDQTTFVTIQPTGVFAGQTSVQVVDGVANFTNLALRLAPTTSTRASFTTSIVLPAWNSSDTSAWNLTIESAICPPGECLDFTNPLECRLCYPGGFSVLPGQTACEKCPPGRFNSEYGQTGCRDCLPGTYNDIAGLGSNSGCPLCPMGMFSQGSGSTACFQCESGIRCENGVAGARAGFWLVPTEAEVAAALNRTGRLQQLSGSGHATQQLAVVRPHAPTSFALELPGPSLTTVPCPGFNCAENSTCSEGRINPASINPLCGQCLPGHSALSNQCVPCDHTRGGLLFLILVAACLFVLALHRLSRTSTGASQVFFYLIQIVLFMSGSISVWLDWISIFQARPSSITGATCVTPMDEYEAMALEIFTPVFLLVILFLFYLGNVALSSDKSRQLLGRYEWMHRLNKWYGEDPLSQKLQSNNQVQARVIAAAQQQQMQREKKEQGRASRASASAATGAVDADELINPSSLASDAEIVVESVDSNSSALTVAPVLPQSTSGSIILPSGALRFGGPSVRASEVATPREWFGAQPHVYLRTAISILLFSYQNVTTVILTHLVCVRAGGHRVVFSDPAMDCDSSAYQRWLPVLITMLIIYPIAMPIILMTRLWWFRDDIYAQKRSLNLAAVARQARAQRASQMAAHSGNGGNGSSGAVEPYREQGIVPAPAAQDSIISSTRPSSMSIVPIVLTGFSLRLGHVYESYRVDYYYWGVVVLFRRAMFVVFDISLTYYPAYRIASFILWNCAMLLVHLLAHPYEDPFNNRMETATLSVLIVVSVVLQMHQVSDSGSEHFGGPNAARYPVAVQVVITLLIAVPCAILLWHMVWSKVKPTFKILQAKRQHRRQQKRASSHMSAVRMEALGVDEAVGADDAEWRSSPAASPPGAHGRSSLALSAASSLPPISDVQEHEADYERPHGIHATNADEVAVQPGHSPASPSYDGGALSPSRSADRTRGESRLGMSPRDPELVIEMEQMSVPPARAFEHDSHAL